MKTKIQLMYIKTLAAGLVLLALSATALSAQPVRSNSSDQRAQSIQKHHEMRTHSVFHDYPVRNVGPVVMSGRVTDLAVNEELPREFYVAFASGGVFKTENSGNSMKPVFDHQGTLTIGDIAIARADDNILWVGTGENNSSRSSYAGAGIYKSADGGKSWSFAGLRNTQHIGRIVTHPTNPDIAWAASIGALYTKNPERGVYKTTDGGKTWKKTLFINDSTGVIDLAINPDNPKVLWAASWERSRKAWNFKEGGPGSAIWKSTDGGETWHKAVKGFPQGDFVGRIGLDVSRSNPDIVYAVLDNQTPSKPEKEKEGAEQLKASDFTDMSRATFLKLDDGKLNHFLRQNGFPRKYTAETVKEDIRQGKYEPKALQEYLGDANEELVSSGVIGAEVYRSEDGGESWSKVNDYEFNILFNTYGYYFGQVRVDPSDPDVIYIMGVPLLKSTDGGHHWKMIAENQPVHGDYHAMWIDPNDSQHLLVGNDGGPYESHDGGINFVHHNNVPVGQFYSVAVDMEKPYNIYGGLQDNNVYMGSSQSVPNKTDHWKSLLGGDGMHVAVDPTNSSLVYAGFQFGNYYRINREKNDYKSIKPRHDLGEERFRYNWNTPVVLSRFNPQIVYFGSQVLNRSFDQGDSWQKISPDLTMDLHGDGDVPYSTITTIEESPLNFNTIWVGTDDGNMQLTRDGGSSWQRIDKGLPRHRWVSKIFASPYDEGTAFVTLTGYRHDEFAAYVYKTTDFGQSWTSLKGNLPEENCNVIVQDPKRPEVLYLGTDQGTYVSMDGGSEWQMLNGLPNVPAYDMLVHPRDLDLVVGTHGRSVYVADVEPIEKVSPRKKEAIVAIQPDTVSFSGRWGSRRAQFMDRYEPATHFLYYLGEDTGGPQQVKITLSNSKGKTIKTFEKDGTYGFNRFSWNLQLKPAEDEESSPTYLDKGSYKLTFTTDNQKDEVPFVVK